MSGVEAGHSLARCATLSTRKHNFSLWCTSRGYGMARKFSRWLHTEHAPRREAPLRLSSLQQSILYWLQNELRRRQRAGDMGSVPYPELVRAIDADKASITSEVRSLLQKDLLGMSLPAGEWVRYIVLTDKGEAYAKTLSGNVQKLRRRR